MPVTPLPTPPNRALPNDTFDDVADEFFSALPVFATELNAMGAFGATSLSTTQTATTVTINSDTGTDAVIPAADGANAGVMSSSAFTKLTDIAPGATTNSADATLLARANHTGTQTASTISDFTEAAQDAVAAALVEGSNVTITHNDAANTIIISAAGGGVQSANDYLTSQAKVNGLVINGSFQDGTNAGFSMLPFGNTNPPPNTVGYVRKTGFYTITSDESLSDNYIPISTNLIYRFDADVRQTVNAGSAARLYIGLMQYDSDNNVISSRHTLYAAGSMTQLASKLSVGDTTVQLVSAAGWVSGGAWYDRCMNFYNYKNSSGFLYEPLTNPYTRRQFCPSGVGGWAASGAISGNTITLSQPFDVPNPDTGDGSYPAGTYVASGNFGAAYNYSFAAAVFLDPSPEWVAIDPLHPTYGYAMNNYVGGGVETTGIQNKKKFFAGIAKAKIFMLANYLGQPSDVLDITNIRLDVAPITKAQAGL